MYKIASENAQRRALGVYKPSGTDSGGLSTSPTTFEELKNRRRALLEDKVKLQDQLAKLNAQIALARRRYNANESGQVNYKTMSRWEAEKANLAASVSDLDKRLTEIKIDISMAVDRNRETFSRTFMQAARDLLAPDAYDRILEETTRRVAR